jgi:DNA-directed RNA polymerase specialized sigma24 family protein
VKPSYNKILKLKYYYNKSVKDISKILNKTEACITSNLYRARQSLRNELVKSKGFFEF